MGYNEKKILVNKIISLQNMSWCYKPFLLANYKNLRIFEIENTGLRLMHVHVYRVSIQVLMSHHRGRLFSVYLDSSTKDGDASTINIRAIVLNVSGFAIP